ncbi:MAG: hypothetical protein E7616_04440 [Ruminococcaceae bacterium]|nr:hypothetical protein [Oscillospiraceae bacterium]
MNESYYLQQIYNLLNKYLPTLETYNKTQANNSGVLNQLIEEIRDLLSGLVSTVSDIALDMVDLRKFVLWFLIAFLSTKILRWGFRI